MATVTTITYATDGSIAVTAWGTSLISGDWATSAIYDNTSTNYVDVLLGGVLELGTTTIVAGDTLDVYLCGQYSETATDMDGAIDALLGAAGEEVEDVSFVKTNLKLLATVNVEATTPDTAQGYHWGPVSVAALFGGIMPKRFMLLLHNNTGGPLAAGSNVNATGITYTHT